MENRFKERRRNYFIKKKFQRNFIIKFCSLVILGSIISGTIIYLMSRSTVTTSFENLRLTVKSTADSILPAVLLSSAIVIVSIGLATIAITLFTSHKIAGPLYRIEKDIEEISSGNLQKKINLRQGDEIKALAASLNEMSRTFRTDIETVKQTVSEMELFADSSELKEKLKRTKEALSKFKT